MATKQQEERLKFSLTRPENPVPVHAYIYARDILYFVVCPCAKKCEITIFIRGDERPLYIDNTSEHLKMLGAMV